MGYTHYWYRPKELDKEKFAKASADCKKVTQWLAEPGRNIHIQYEYTDSRPPVFTDELVRFNGVGEEGHETFLIAQKHETSFPQTDKEGRYFAFCKTARKDYDPAVTACLTIFKHYFGDDFIVKSDGYKDEWEGGVMAVWECLGYGETPFFKERRSGPWRGG